MCSSKERIVSESYLEKLGVYCFTARPKMQSFHYVHLMSVLKCIDGVVDCLGWY